MRTGSIAAIGALLVVAVANLTSVTQSATATAPPAPTCFNYRTQTVLTATKWLTTPGTLVGTPGDDVLVGTLQSDTIKGLAGNDVICSSPFETGQTGAPDTIDGGSGNDDIVGRGDLNGGTGSDFVLVIFFGSHATGGSGNDTVIGSFGGVADGGNGDDQVESGFGGAGALYGGSGSDTVLNLVGTDRIDCGTGSDRVFANGATDVRRCENTFIPPI
jgi:Ca2+-binding RTX toxin-like protein